jgi:hypothetical protein
MDDTQRIANLRAALEVIRDRDYSHPAGATTISETVYTDAVAALQSIAASALGDDDDAAASKGPPSAPVEGGAHQSPPEPASTIEDIIEPEVIWLCPTCGGPVADDHRWVDAEEVEDAPGFGQEHDVARGGHVRFHEGHFRSHVSGKVYRQTADDTPRAEP